MQPICNYYYNIMLMFLFIHPLMMNFIDFYCNSFTTTGMVEMH
jgi:hypothetical protein